MAAKHFSCSVDGCDNDRHKDSFCLNHLRRARRHNGNPLGGTARGDAMKFLAKLIASPPRSDKCVIWPFGRTAAGYGVVAFDGRTQYVHRIVLAHCSNHTGRHQRLHAAHSCGNGHLGCVNIAHLRWASASENSLDRLAHGTMIRGEWIAGSKLNSRKVFRMRMQKSQDRTSYRKLARQYGVDKETCRSAILGLTWKHVPFP